MADNHNHPFNSDVIAHDRIRQLELHLSIQGKEDISEYRHQKNLDELLFLKDRNSYFSSSTDSTPSIALHSISDDDFNRLKYLLRSVVWPIDHHIREQLWINILTLYRISSINQNNHVTQTSQTVLSSSAMIDTNFGSLSLKYEHWPNFVDTTNLCFYYLTERRGQSLVHGILLTFSSYHPDVTYSPILQPVAALLLHYHNEYEVLYLLNRLLIKNWLCGETRLQWEAHCNVFRKLLKKYYKSAADVINSRYKNVNGFYHDWLWWIFHYLPFSYLVKIMDCFLLEGTKVLFRISLALAHVFTKNIRRESDETIHNITDFCRHIPISIGRLLNIAFHIRNLKRRTIEQLIEHEEKLLRSTRHQLHIDNANENHHVSTNHEMTSNRPPPSITPQHLTQIPQESTLSQQQFLTLWNWLPARLSLSQPMVVFTTDEHGFRLQTLLNKVDELEYSILVVKTTNGEIFGAFCAGLWSDRRNRAYFGCGESFLFTLIPKQKKYVWVGQQQPANNRQNQVKREMFLFVDNDKLIIGGGNGDGLCIDQSLCEGQTAHCETFDNEPLCSQSFFSISVLEMITFDYSAS
ncbi:unnamed protein product [Rotaria socialis]|uniref:TBC1 domain family member 24 n=1 Tax=Rotaria socialis TaxID=392032 RepID=A0A821PFF9_9BILA|nr:unnamed protein product [Rotaria socialis]CAF4802287.1 unnamed protein product [Rotaria socialis]